jgi:hypothetical protein
LSECLRNFELLVLRVMLGSAPDSVAMMSDIPLIQELQYNWPFKTYRYRYNSNSTLIIILMTLSTRVLSIIILNLFLNCVIMTYIIVLDAHCNSAPFSP